MANSDNKRMRGAAKPATMSQEEVRAMCAAHATVPIWPQAGQAIGMSKDKTYSAAHSGDLPGVIRIGTKIVMSTAVLARMLGLNEERAA